MKATRLLLAAMVLGTVVGASQANAQSCGGIGSCNLINTASVSVGALVKLGMSSLTTTLTNPTGDDLGATPIANDGPTFTIKANRSWTLKIKTSAATWAYSGSNSGVKSISDLKWSLTSGGTFVAITGTDATFTSGASSNGTSAQAFFQTTWLSDFTDASNAPGTYSLPIVFTLTAP
jgi:hypothetical protein